MITTFLPDGHDLPSHWSRPSLALVTTFPRVGHAPLRDGRDLSSRWSRPSCATVATFPHDDHDPLRDGRDLPARSPRPSSRWSQPSLAWVTTFLREGRDLPSRRSLRTARCSQWSTPRVTTIAVERVDGHDPRWPPTSPRARPDSLGLAPRCATIMTLIAEGDGFGHSQSFPSEATCMTGTHFDRARLRFASPPLPALIFNRDDRITTTVSACATTGCERRDPIRHGRSAHVRGS
jgi:hypothetical protein